MSKNDKKRRIILEIMGGFILLAIIIFSVFFLNRKYEVSFYLDNGSDVQVVYVKHNKIINSSNIKGKEDLGESFVDWYEIVDVKDGLSSVSSQLGNATNHIIEHNKQILLSEVASVKAENTSIKKLVVFCLLVTFISVILNIIILL